MDVIATYQWEFFIAVEVLSLLSIFLFGIFRYVFNKSRVSILFILVFILLLFCEALVGLYIYQATGEVSPFTIIITVFVAYACTFGVFDFMRLDRWMRRKIGQWRGIELLSEKDYKIIERNRNPKYVAKKYRISSLLHLVVFVIGQTIFWWMGTGSFAEMKAYLTDLSWLDERDAEGSPYPSETLYTIGVIWGIVFIADFIYSWSYTLFPSKK
ncbi:hypothetical protein [Sporosarcina sp. Te-1]|uniref:hypothetical protein n=1 Tax=Sporosarcina sp. Te-1 TaxID=2818390 RepID=UPI001A9DE4CF|nr:hypothetical protein [Sporosarcina sp. Te-1]QTD41876.1 hypothetical protein J3U78_03200 [Sporosarcina sp. Te-1]